jgi:hypothetical protein
MARNKVQAAADHHPLVKPKILKTFSIGVIALRRSESVHPSGMEEKCAI